MVIFPVKEKKFNFSQESLFRSVIIFQGDKLDIFYFVITFVAGFFIKATFFIFDVYFKKIKGPIFGKAQRDLSDFRINTS